MNKVMAEINTAVSKEWGMVYLTKKGFTLVTSNLDESPSNWFARFYYKDNHGNIYFKQGEGRKLYLDINKNNNENKFSLKKYIAAIRLELKEINNIEKGLSDIEKMLSNGSGSIN